MVPTKPLSERTLTELRILAQGCTEITCKYHGRVNLEIKRRIGLYDLKRLRPMQGPVSGPVE